MTCTIRPRTFTSALVLAVVFAIALSSAAFAEVTTDTIAVTAINDEQQSSSVWIDGPDDYMSFDFESTKWSGTYSNTDIDVLSDSSTTGSSWAYESSWWGSGEAAPHITVVAYGKGTHNIVVRQSYLNAKGKAVHYINYTLTVTLKSVGITKDNIVSYKNKKTSLKTENLDGAVTWKSTDSKIASVSSAGVVTGKKLGKCYIQATGTSARTGEAVTVECLVEVTYKKAYKAVRNAWTDYYNSALKYSQPKRMKKNYRDCSSYVGRCYWDSSLKRKLVAIGGSDAKYWSYNASAQARWLNSHKKKVAKKAVSLSKLLPGDTIYYETDYAGRNNEYRHIDHAAIYVGGGVVLNTSSYGAYGCIGNRGYCQGDKSVKFIGRPCK